MQRENHRDRRPYRIFHPLSHRVQKQLPYKYSVSPAFYKKIRHANVLAGPTQERAGRKRTGGTPCLYPLCPLKRIGNKFRHAGRTDKHSVSVGSSLRPKWPLLKNRQDRLLPRRTFRQATNLCSRLSPFVKIGRYGNHPSTEKLFGKHTVPERAPHIHMRPQNAHPPTKIPIPPAGLSRAGPSPLQAAAPRRESARPSVLAGPSSRRARTGSEPSPPRRTRRSSPDARAGRSHP